MKRVIVALAIAFGTLTVTYAQSSSTEIPTKAQKASVQDDYKEVKVSNAYANGKGEFKLVVTTADKLSKTLYANSKGEWIKKQ